MRNDDLGVFANDADIEQHNLEKAGNRISALRKQGICLHGYRNTKTLKCLDCNKTWTTEDEMFTEISNLHIEYEI